MEGGPEEEAHPRGVAHAVNDDSQAPPLFLALAKHYSILTEVTTICHDSLPMTVDSASVSVWFWAKWFWAKRRGRDVLPGDRQPAIPAPQTLFFRGGAVE